MSSGKRNGRVTLLDVAREAGVSRATASLVIRKSPLVGAETRRRVEETLERLGYVYNMGAASMRAARSNMVGVVIPNLSNPFFAELLSGIESALDGASLVVVLANSRESAAHQDGIVRRMRERGVDGLIVCPAAKTRPAFLKHAAEWGLPLVQVLRYVSESNGDYSGTDYAGGMRQAVDHLSGLGHRSIAFVTGGAMHSAHAERLAGFRLAMQSHGLDPGLTIEVPLAASGSPESAQRLLRDAAKPTSAICFNDIVAAGLSSGLVDAGVKVGAEFSVVGFDDLAVAELVRPRLTSVATFPAEIGETAARLLLDRLASPERAFRRMVSVTQLFERQSSGPVPGRT